jgi:predicted  nucleic acid-binding Zn-ribbon protein
MAEHTPHTSSDPTNLGESDPIAVSLQRLSKKIELVSDAIKALHLDRSQLETKIEDAQKRIQHILSRLPEQSDGRQLNLLGESATPTNPEDNNEPTTH